MRGSIPVVLAIAAVCLLTSPITAAEDPGTTATLFGRDAPEASGLRELYRSAGRVAPTTSYPVSRSTLIDRAGRLYERTSDVDVRTEVREYIERISLPAGEIRVEAEVEVTARSATELAARDIDDDFGRAYHARPPSITTRLSLESPDSILLSITDERRRELREVGYDNFPRFRSGNPFAPENNSIRDSYLWTRLGAIELTLGRQNIEIDPSAFTGFAVSPDVPFLDALRLYAPVGPLSAK